MEVLASPWYHAQVSVHIPRKSITMSCVRSIFSNLRNLPINFSTGGISLHFHQKRELLFPYILANIYLLSVFLMEILMG